ncbi:MAG: type II toxin-antitoxin system CcdA family antitoxin [Sphingomonadales bacterium]
MVHPLKRKTSLTLDRQALSAAKALGVNVSAVADEALKKAVIEARRQKWLEDNADAFAAQSRWHQENGHPLADIMAGDLSATWSN